MARIGTGVNASLGAVDYSSYLKGSVAGSEAIGRGIAALGAGAGAAIDRYQKTKQEEELEKALGNTELSTLTSNIQQSKQASNKDLYAAAPNVTTEQIADLNRRINSSKKAERKAAIAEVASLNQSFKEAPAKAIQSLQFNAAQGALKQQEQEIKNTEAMTAAFTGIPQTKQTTVKVPELEVTSKAPAFKGLDEFMYGNTKQQSPAKTVINQAPAGAAEFLGQNQLTGQYQYLGDRAAQTIAEQEQLSQQAMPRIEEIKKMVKDGYVTVTKPLMASGRQGIPTAQTQNIPLTEEQKINLQNEQFALEGQITQQIAKVNEIKQRAATAEKFSGQPLTKEAGDPVIERAANALSAFDNRVDVLKREVTANIVDREKTLDVPLTPDERMQEFMTRYIEKGGQVNTKMIGEIQRAVRVDMEHFKFGDVQGVRIGDTVKLFDSEKKPLSVASMRYADERMYEQLVSVAAKAGIDRLSPEDREILAQLNNKYGPEDVDIMTNTRRKRLLADVVNERAVNLGLASRPAAIVPTPATPSKTGASRFGVSVVK
jgi:hypothetical protein